MVVCDSIAGFAKYSLNEMITNKPKAFSSSTLSKVFLQVFLCFVTSCIACFPAIRLNC